MRLSRQIVLTGLLSTSLLALLAGPVSGLQVQATAPSLNPPRVYLSPPRPGKGQVLECSNPDWSTGLTPGAKRVFRAACITHDFCYRHGYRTYNHSRNSCDLQMLHRMEATCQDEYSSTADRAQCQVRAQTLYLGLQTCAEGSILGIEYDTGACAAFRDKGSRAVEYESNLVNPPYTAERITWPKLGDVNGDKRADLVYYFGTNSDADIAIRTKAFPSTGVWTQWHGDLTWSTSVFNYPTVSGDFNGDKRMDLVMPYNYGGKLVIHLVRSQGNGQWVGTEQTNFAPLGIQVASTGLGRPTLEGDVNGDRISDLIFITQRGNQAGLWVDTFLGSQAGTWTHRSYFNTWTDVHEYPTLVGDVNGDGRADLIFPIQEGNAQSLTVKVLFSSGSTWAPATQPIGWGHAVHPAIVGDINGDRKADLIFVFPTGSGYEVRTLISKGDGTWNGQTELINWGSQGILEYPTLVGDVNGDGKTDLVFPYHNSNRGVVVVTFTSIGGGTWNASEQTFGWGGDWLKYPTMLGDIDGDLKADLIFPWHEKAGLGLPGLSVRYLRGFTNGVWTLDGIKAFGDWKEVLNGPVP